MREIGTLFCKRIQAVFLLAVVLVLLSGNQVKAADLTADTWDKLSENITNGDGDKTIEITQNLTAGKTIKIEKGTVRIYWKNNLTIDKTDSFIKKGNPMFIVNEGAELKLYCANKEVKTLTVKGGDSGTFVEVNGQFHIANAAVKTTKVDISNFGSSAIVNAVTGQFSTVKDVTIKNCKGTDGGAIYNEGSVTFRGEIDNCNVTGKGGAIYNTNKCIIEDVLNVNNCDAGGSGGAIFNSKTFTIKDGTAGSFNACIAGTSGGAIYNSGSCTIPENVTIEECKALSSNGGAIANTKNALLTSNAIISECEAKKGKGGAIYNNGKECSVVGKASITRCDALSGGAIYNATSGIATIEQCTINGCCASSESRTIHNNGEMEIKSIKIENSADARGDILHKDGSLTLNPEGTGEITISGIELNKYMKITSNGDFKGKVKISSSNITPTADNSYKAKVIDLAETVDSSAVLKWVTISDAEKDDASLILGSRNIVKTPRIKSVSFNRESFLPILVVNDTNEKNTLKGTYKNECNAKQTWSQPDANKSCLEIQTDKAGGTCILIPKENCTKPLTVNYSVSNPLIPNEVKKISANVWCVNKPSAKLDKSKYVLGDKATMSEVAVSKEYKDSNNSQRCDTDYLWQYTDDGEKWSSVKSGTEKTLTVSISDKLIGRQYRCRVTFTDSASNSSRKVYSNVIKFTDLNIVKKKATVTFGDKKAVYNGSPIGMDLPVVSPQSLTKKIYYTYYTDVACKTKTNAKNGALKEGGEPVNVGTYYVVARMNETDNYQAVKTNFKVLEITKATGKLAAKEKKMTMTMGTYSNIILTNNAGYENYHIEVSEPKMLKAEVKNGVVVCTPIMPGECTVSIRGEDNSNVSASETMVAVSCYPGKVKLKSIKMKKGGIAFINFKVQKGMTNYQAQYATNSKFKKKKNINYELKVKVGLIKNTAAKKNDPRALLKPKKVYYFRIRAVYKNPKTGKKYVGAWSNVIKKRAK